MDKTIIYSVVSSLLILFVTWVVTWVKKSVSSLNELHEGQSEYTNKLEKRLLVMEKQLNDDKTDEIRSSYKDHQKIMDRMEHLFNQYDKKIEHLEKRLYNNMITNTEFYKQISICRNDVVEKIKSIKTNNICGIEHSSILKLSKKVLKNTIDIQEVHVLLNNHLEKTDNHI